MLHPPKRHAVLKVFTENKLFYFSKRTSRADTARNKWLKEALKTLEFKFQTPLFQIPFKYVSE